MRFIIKLLQRIVVYVAPKSQVPFLTSKISIPTDRHFIIKNDIFEFNESWKSVSVNQYLSFWEDKKHEMYNKVHGTGWTVVSSGEQK